MKKATYLLKKFKSSKLGWSTLRKSAKSYGRLLDGDLMNCV